MLSKSEYESRKQDKRDRLAERAEKVRAKSDERFQRSRDLIEPIPFGQPILVGHHSERAHRNRLKKSDDAMRKGIELSDYADNLEDRAENYGKNNGIQSDDPDALRQLRVKLDGLQSSQEIMKAINAAWRKAGKPGKDASEDDWERLYTELEKVSIAPLSMFKSVKKSILNDFMDRAPFTYHLQNNNAEIRRTKQRLDQVSKVQSAEIDLEIEGIRVYISDDQKIVIKFPGKPDAVTRSMIKGKAFKWSRNRDGGSWVRKVTPNALAAFNYHIKDNLQGVSYE